LVLSWYLVDIKSVLRFLRYWDTKRVSRMVQIGTDLNIHKVLPRIDTPDHWGESMKRIRVLVANRPRMMRELLLATISDQPDIEIVGELQDDTQVFESVERTQPDFLIIALEETGERPALCDLILDRHPQTRIIALSPEGNLSIFYWASLKIRSNQIETSEEGILNALRTKSQLVG
jgi:hypothetical protein